MTSSIKNLFSSVNKSTLEQENFIYETKDGKKIEKTKGIVKDIKLEV